MTRSRNFHGFTVSHSLLSLLIYYFSILHNISGGCLNSEYHPLSQNIFLGK